MELAWYFEFQLLLKDVRSETYFVRACDVDEQRRDQWTAYALGEPVLEGTSALLLCFALHEEYERGNAWLFQSASELQAFTAVRPVRYRMYVQVPEVPVRGLRGAAL
jgi:hypothetical protein